QNLQGNSGSRHCYFSFGILLGVRISDFGFLAQLPSMTGLVPQPSQHGQSLRWRQVRILYLREMRAALREKTIILNSILIPIFLYPFLMWAAFTGLTLVMGQSERFVSRIVVANWPAG